MSDPLAKDDVTCHSFVVADVVSPLCLSSCWPLESSFGPLSPGIRLFKTEAPTHDVAPTAPTAAAVLAKDRRGVGGGAPIAPGQNREINVNQSQWARSITMGPLKDGLRCHGVSDIQDQRGSRTFGSTTRSSAVMRERRNAFPARYRHRGRHAWPYSAWTGAAIKLMAVDFGGLARPNLAVVLASRSPSGITPRVCGPISSLRRSPRPECQ